MGDAPQPTPPLPLASRVVMAFTGPGRLGDELGRHPRWLGALILSTILATALTAALYFTPQGKAMLLAEFKKNAGPAPGVDFEQLYPMMAGFGVGGSLVVTPILFLLMAGILWVLFTAIMSAEMGYRHHFAVVLHTYAIAVVGYGLNLALMLSRGSMRSTLSLAAFVPNAKETDLVYLLLAVFDFFTLWWLCATGVAVARAGRIKPATGVATLLVLYFVIAGAVVGVRVALGSAFSVTAK